MKFNKQQQLAIDHKDGACVVISGAGSGKTTLLIGRISNLIEKYNINQKDILTISFTRNTANELKKKLKALNYTDVSVGTFHSICMRILSNEGIDVRNHLIPEWESKKCFETALVTDKVDTKEILSFIGYQKSYMKSYKDEFVFKDCKYTDDDMRLCYKAYETLKTKNGFYDLDDYLLLCYDVLLKNKGKYTWKYLLVDEHQDSNIIQNLLIKEWINTDNIMVIGDFRQSIYGFRGALPELFMNFYKEYKNTNVVNMDINYRSCKNLVDNSNRFIKKYYGDYKYYSDSVANTDDNGDINKYSYFDRKEESHDIVDKIEKLIQDEHDVNEIAILYRNNSHADYIECELRHRKLPYQISNDSSFFKRKEISLIVGYLRLINNVHDDEAFEIIYKAQCYPTKFFGGKIFDDIKSKAGQKNISYYESFISYNYPKTWQSSNERVFEKNIQYLKMQNEKHISIQTLIDNIVKSFQIKEYITDKYENIDDQTDRINSIETLKKFIKGDNLGSFIDYVNNPINKKSKDDGIKMMTIHGSKGLEFDTVFVVGIEEGKFPNAKSDLLEEARLMYVAITRPRKNLYLSSILDSTFVNEYFGEDIHK